MIIFFFFKQKTGYEMRIRDWSSDVCSSDLAADLAACMQHRGVFAPREGVADLGQAVFGQLLRKGHRHLAGAGQRTGPALGQQILDLQPVVVCHGRSDERRVGKECGRTCRSRWSPSNETKIKLNTIQL